MQCGLSIEDGALFVGSNPAISNLALHSMRPACIVKSIRQ